MEKTKDD